MIIKLESTISLEEVLRRIEYADGGEIDEMIDAVQRRYHRLFPDWEVTFLSMPVGKETDRIDHAQRLIEFIQKHYLDL